jgi:DNA-binding CsgD family transcriptional regulator
MSASQAEHLDHWERRALPLLNLMPYVLLVISTALAVGIDHGNGAKLALDLAGSALCALWMLWLITLHPAWEQRPVRMGVFFVGLMAFAAVLVVNDPVYGFFSWTGYLWIYRVLQGNCQSVPSPSVASRLMTQIRTPAEGSLSDRELEVLTLVARGASNRGAAQALLISEATVKTHLLHIYAKLSVSDRAAAVAEAFNRGLLTPREAGR